MTRAVLIAGLAVLFLSACASTPRGGKGPLISPLPNLEVSSKFGRRSATRPHYGIDIRAPRSTPISAAGAAKVRFAGMQRGFGKIVILDHGGGLETWYAHMSDFAVRKGDRVAQGQTIGFVGQTGNATGPHLHFEVREKGTPRDPLLWLSDTPRS